MVYYEEHSVNEIVFLFEYIYSEDKRKFSLYRFYYVIRKRFYKANRENYTIIGNHYCIIKNCASYYPFLMSEPKY